MLLHEHIKTVDFDIKKLNRSFAIICEMVYGKKEKSINYIELIAYRKRKDVDSISTFVYDGISDRVVET